LSAGERVDDGGPRLFEPFVTHGKAGGSGLALAIVQQIVVAHGGRIGVTSSTDGTTFTMEFPVSAHSGDQVA